MERKGKIQRERE
uniref:Uncharacterized protein n=1 Tax=Anguilla anguilla TaxID=7936 RepID=A0A0E9QXP3_ANGAN